MLITSRLDQDVEHHAVLVDGSPQPVATTTDADRHFVEMPFVARSRSATPQLQSKCGSELGAPAPYGLVTNLNAAFSNEFLDVVEAQVEAKVQPDSVGYDLGWATMSAVERGRTGEHQPILRPLRRYCPARRSLTRGAWISSAPAAVVTVRGSATPLRTTSACPAAARCSAWSATY